ncbi:hypothetical protein V1477_014985 [Vespula maculifrons]|uniref:Uncharacterized protein n=1 Tax=Vespula maculifrons TaxID=7453 RepID=A0ABD2BJ06_VESMC
MTTDRLLIEKRKFYMLGGINDTKCINKHSITIISFENRTISFGNLKKNYGNACSLLMNEAFEKYHFRKCFNISCRVPSCLFERKNKS